MFWTGVEALAVWAYTILVTLTLWFLYRQVRTAAKTFQLDAARRLQELVDDFRGDRRQLFTTLPLELALRDQQFLTRPSGRRTVARSSENEIARMALDDEQKTALGALGEDQRELARRVIGRLNDIGALIEDGLVERGAFLGKYHVMVIQCCHLVEAVRRDEEMGRGGNYGQRLLRMRRWAVLYNDASPKHRTVPVHITNGSTKRVVYRSPAATIQRRIVWVFRRWTGSY